MPVPLKVTATELPLVELLLTVSFPLAAPLAVGLNCTVIVAVADGFSVIGKLPPTVVNPGPLMVAEFTVTAVVPVDFNVTDRVDAVLTARLPKLRLVGLTVNCGLDAVPVPLRATVAVPPVVELLLTVIFPVAAPEAVGLNCTCKVTDCLGCSVSGKV